MKAKKFAFLEISFLVGAFVAPLFTEEIAWLYLGLFLSLASLFMFKVNKGWFILLGIGLVFLSLYRFQSREAYYEQQNRLISGKEIFYSGTVAYLPIEKEYGDKVIVQLKHNLGKILLYTDKDKLRFGQEVYFKGKVKKYDKNRTYLIKEGVIGELSAKEIKVTGDDRSLATQTKRFLFGLREKINGALTEALPQKEAALAGGLILGEKQFLSADFVRSLQGSGTSHIIALSGYNITIIIGLFAVFYPFLSRKVNLLLPVAFVIAFVVMTGGAASVVRASIMGLMPLAARYLGRDTDSFLAILFSATVMVLLNPFILLYDVGFQLSFAALVGMIYLAPFLEKLFKYWPNTPRKIFSESVCAQVGVLPLILYYFGIVSIISPISNLLILLLIPFAMLGSFVVAIVQLAFPILNTLLVFPVYFILHAVLSLIEYFGNLPFATQQKKIDNPYLVILVYLLFIDLLFLIRNKRRKKFEEEII
jgi:competence protein ComEC